MISITLPEMTGLSPAQQKAVMLLLDGKTTADVAAQCGVDRKTIFNWSHRNERFRFCLDATREALAQYWAANLIESTRASLELLNRVVTSEDVPTRVRLRAALEVLKRDEKKGAWNSTVIPASPSSTELHPGDLCLDELPPDSPEIVFSSPELPGPPPATPRNAFCPCGSGEKFKRCCGRDAPPVDNAA
jgi:hypothetical protein